MKSKCGCTKERKSPVSTTPGFGHARRGRAPQQRQGARGRVQSAGYDAVTRSGMSGTSQSESPQEPLRDAAVDASSHAAALRDPRTGLPRGIKRAAEARSGLAMDDVRVRYNSPLPGNVRAKAATRGARIDVGPGEDDQIGHELWHVVQQKMRRVSADSERGGQTVNRDAALESEADAFRDDAMQSRGFGGLPEGLRSVSAPAMAPMQLQDSSDDESESSSDESEDERRRTKFKRKAKTPAKKPVKKPEVSKLKRKASKQSISSSSETGDSSSGSGEEESSSGSSGEENESSSSSGEEESSSSSSGESSVGPTVKKLKGGTTSSPKAMKVAVKKKALKEEKPAEKIKASPKKKSAKASDDEDDSGIEVEEADWEKDLLNFHGVKQQGKVSVAKGKHYAGPRSMKAKRADQVSRHVANLTLNRATKDQKTKGSKMKPVEVQMSSVGGRVLINANNRESTETIASGVGKGSLFDYVTSDEAQRPALDQDTLRPMRYRSKLQKAKAKTRPWQKKGTVGEDATDAGKAEKILESIQQPGIGTFDPDDEPGIKSQIEDWKKGKGPKSYVVLHGKGNIKGEHAERVQTAFRDKWLKDFEDPKLSTPPTGPKTTCLGCTSFHAANYPHILPTPDLSGAYFSSGSPATTKKEIEEATSTAKSKPATGSIGQEGYTRNSDYPDSDSDDEGKPSFPRALSFTLPVGGKNPAKRKWAINAKERLEVKSTEKRFQVENRRRKSKGEKALPKPTNPSVPKAAPRKKKSTTDTKTGKTPVKTPTKTAQQKKKLKVSDS